MKPPSLVPLEVGRRMESTRRKTRNRREKNVPPRTKSPMRELVRSSRPPSPDLEFFYDDFAIDSARVRRELALRGLAYLAHAVEAGTLTPARKRLVELAGASRKLPFLIDHRTGIKLEGRNAILDYLIKEYPTQREREQERTRAGLSGPEAWLTGTRHAAERANRLVRDQARDIRNRLGLPIRDARELAEQWRRTIDATTASARNAIQAIGEIAIDLRREWTNAEPGTSRGSSRGQTRRREGGRRAA